MTAASDPNSRRLHVLFAVFEAAEGKTGASVDVDDVWARIPEGAVEDRQSLEDELKLLIKSQQLDGFLSIGGLNQVFLRPEGKSAAQQFAALRADSVARLRQLQDDYLRWIYAEEELHGRGATPTAYLATSPHFLGVPYTAKELEKAGERLREGAFISGQSAWQYAGPLRPTLTAKGRYVAENGGSVRDSARPAATVQNNFTTHVQGNANVANASPGAKQSMVVVGWDSQVTETLDAIARAMGVLPEDIRSVLTPLVAEARAGVTAKEPGRTRRALQAAGGFLSDSASGALGGVLGAQVLALLPLLGG